MNSLARTAPKLPCTRSCTVRHPTVVPHYPTVAHKACSRRAPIAQASPADELGKAGEPQAPLHLLFQVSLLSLLMSDAASGAWMDLARLVASSNTSNSPYADLAGAIGE